MNDVFGVSGCVCCEDLIGLNEVSTVDAPVALVVLKERAISRVGFLKRRGCSACCRVEGLSKGCFLFKDPVNLFCGSRIITVGRGSLDDVER